MRYAMEMAEEEIWGRRVGDEPRSETISQAHPGDQVFNPLPSSLLPARAKCKLETILRPVGVVFTSLWLPPGLLRNLHRQHVDNTPGAVNYGNASHAKAKLEDYPTSAPRRAQHADLETVRLGFASRTTCTPSCARRRIRSFEEYTFARSARFQAHSVRGSSGETSRSTRLRRRTSSPKQMSVLLLRS
ncbi:unnamed protein product [Zymoseptoria tritici ST99CH_1A5]|uniref:Uncharacterized protein n=1 Tax=Zymoseptoria tritici ST99CH_1A5 TaxID=1276529 RepID=A0A1Y6M0L5_ZYMTR|nr:unnamed protein product [Zymoseptoria tritici ST99CH_1A5]